MAHFRVKAVTDASGGPYLRVDGLGGGVQTLEAWLTQVGDINAQVPSMTAFTCFDTSGTPIALEPWSYIYTLTGVCTLVDGREVWSAPTANRMMVVYTSTLQLAFFSRDAAQICKLRYTVEQRDFKSMIGYNKVSSSTAAQCLLDAPFEGPNDVYTPYSNYGILLPREYYAKRSKLKTYKITDLQTGEDIPPSTISTYNITIKSVGGVSVCQVAFTKPSAIPNRAYLKVEFGFED